MPDIWQIMLSIKLKIMRKAMQNSEYNIKKKSERREKERKPYSTTIKIY